MLCIDINRPLLNITYAIGCLILRKRFRLTSFLTKSLNTDHLMQKDSWRSVTDTSEEQLSHESLTKFANLRNTIRSIDTVNVKQGQLQTFTNLASIVQGQVAGVYVQRPTGEPGAYQNIVIRGANSPTFDKQLAISNYWSYLPGNKVLPGTGRSEDRFARATYYAKAVEQSSDERISVGAAFSIIRNCSVPYGVHIDGEPNLSSTRWRTVSDQKNLKYYYEDPISLTPLWLDLKSLDFSEKAKVQKLALSKSEQYLGEANTQLKEAKPFKFLGI